jgi:hypothetical protein
MNNSNLSEAGHQKVFSYISEEQSSELEHSLMDFVLISKFNKVSLLSNKDLPSISSVEEYIQGHRHKIGTYCIMQLTDEGGCIYGLGRKIVNRRDWWGNKASR